jgi:uncharacterized membrane protein YoaK (UPF0700 family)
MSSVELPLEPSARSLCATVPLSFVAGFVDLVGFVALYGLFASHITGNFTVIGADIVHGTSGLIAKLLALPIFVVVVVITRFIVLGYEKMNRFPLRTLLLIQGLLLAGCMFVGQSVSPVTDPDKAGPILAGLLGVAAMAVQNGYGRLVLVGHPTTTIMTVNLTQTVIDFVDMYRGVAGVSEQARQRFERIAPTVLAFIGGTVAGAYGYIQLTFWSLALPLAALLAIGIFVSPASAPKESTS